jgi:hypothetical protein
MHGDLEVLLKGFKETDSGGKVGEQAESAGGENIGKRVGSATDFQVGESERGI